MRAVVRRGHDLVCDEIADRRPGPGQVLVKTLCCGICGSDLHARHHLEHMAELGERAGGGRSMDPSKDMVFGHEFCAELLDYGPGSAKPLAVGTRVVSMPVTFDDAGMAAVGYSNTYPGGFGERMVLSEALLLPVPNGLPTQIAALTEPFAVGEHAVAAATLGADAVALVIGCGPVGLAVIASLKARGFGPVIASDYSPRRRRLAELLGADEVVDPGAGSPHALWAKHGVHATLRERMFARMAGNEGKRPVIFECVGVPGILNSLMEQGPPGAQIVVAGVCMQADVIEPYLGISKQIELKFVLGYSPEEFGLTLHRLAEGTIDGAPTITDTVGLAGVADAFDRLADPETQVKIMVEPGRA